MKGLLAIDPGLRGVGLAYFVDATLVHANYVPNTVEGVGPAAWFGMGDAVYHYMKDRGYRVDVYVTEYPQVYKVSPGDPNDLIQIAAVAAACGCSFNLERAVGYRPRAWKGTTPKTRHHPRILAKLSDEEKATIAEKRKTYAHNVYDAIGLGIYELEHTGVRAITMEKL
jgi:hypothetical protein